jgi:hypothetical protein
MFSTAYDSLDVPLMMALWGPKRIWSLPENVYKSKLANKRLSLSTTRQEEHSNRPRNVTDVTNGNALFSRKRVGVQAYHPANV